MTKKNHNTPERSSASEAEEIFNEDPIITQSLNSLSTRHAPSGLLPNVMFRVYEKHYRRAISFSHVFLTSCLLLIATIALFTWDLCDTMRSQEHLNSLAEAASQRANQTLSLFDEWLVAISKIIAGSWHLLSALATKIGTNLLILILVVFIVLTAFTKKWLALLSSP